MNNAQIQVLAVHMLLRYLDSWVFILLTAPSCMEAVTSLAKVGHVGSFWVLKWRYISTIFWAIFSGDIPLHRLKK